MCIGVNSIFGKFATNAGAELKTSTLIKGLLKEDGKVVGVVVDDNYDS
jgi:hypothetical protein